MLTFNVSIVVSTFSSGDILHKDTYPANESEVYAALYALDASAAASFARNHTVDFKPPPETDPNA